VGKRGARHRHWRHAGARTASRPPPGPRMPSLQPPSSAPAHHGSPSLAVMAPHSFIMGTPPKGAGLTLPQLVPEKARGEPYWVRTTERGVTRTGWRGLPKPTRGKAGARHRQDRQAPPGGSDALGRREAVRRAPCFLGAVHACFCFKGIFVLVNRQANRMVLSSNVCIFQWYFTEANIFNSILRKS